MQSSRTWLLAALFSFGGSPALFAAPPEEIIAPVHKVFAPLGFDNNDNSEVVVHGEFTSTCFKVGNAYARVNHRRKVIDVTVTAFHYRGAICAQMSLPFIKSVPLGILNPGAYNIRVNGRPQAETTPLVIAHTNNREADDFLYAPVEQAELVKDYAQNKVYLELSGTYPIMLVGCMQIKEVTTQLTPGNVVVVRPIAEIREDGSCDARGRFKHRAELSSLEAGEYLLHTRALSHTSLNSYTNILE